MTKLAKVNIFFAEREYMDDVKDVAVFFKKKSESNEPDFASKAYTGLALIIITLLLSLLDGLIFFDMTSKMEDWDEKDWDAYDEYVDYSNYLELMIIPMIQLFGIFLIFSDLKNIKAFILSKTNYLLEKSNSNEEIQERFAKVDDLQKKFMVKFDNILDKLDEIEKE